MSPADALRSDGDPTETIEWRESLNAVMEAKGTGRASFLLSRLLDLAHKQGLDIPYALNTPYINTIPTSEEPAYPGDRAIERRIKSIIRWNAMAMVVRANRQSSGIGGHISTYQSVATMLEVGFNHFFRARTKPGTGDLIYFQGHASPGIYSRAYLEGRLSLHHLENFRRELADGGGLSSYPHPWLMPDFWQFPTVSMGLTSLQAIYQARFNEYLKDRGLVDTSDCKVWAFLGDGEMDEPESLGAITLASREKLNNLIFVVNCNLQRLDGPVRGNGKIVQELEAAFRGAGWNVLKVLWGSDWDPILEADEEGLLIRRMNQVVDGELQKYVVEPGSYVREHFFGVNEKLMKLVEHLPDEKLNRMRRGGHDPQKVYAAYKRAYESQDGPTVILAQTVKGYGMGEAGEGRNITHQQKKLSEEELHDFRDRFDIPITDRDLAEAPFYRPPENSEELRYLRERREELGGFVPQRVVTAPGLDTPPLDALANFLGGSGDREVSTTMAFVQMLAKLLKDKTLGQLIVSIVPDEARTFGMEALFRSCGIYAHQGQMYEPVDSHLLLYYREAQDGQILEEGITEAGAASSWIASGTSYSNHGTPTIPFYIFYSMFGFQRIGDLIWAAADQRTRGFLLGATYGRTALNGEGLQHQDGHSHLISSTVPNCMAYEPAWAYEIAVIVQEGLRRMYKDGEDIFYYITLANENYAMAPMAQGVEEGILRGMYRFRAGDASAERRVHLMGSGTILTECIRAADQLAERWGVQCDIYSCTSFPELRKDALSVERWNLHHPEEKARVPYITSLLGGEDIPIVAASDNTRTLPDLVRPWISSSMMTLGTDGFGRSDDRGSLRDFFEMDAKYIAFATLTQVFRAGKLPLEELVEARSELGIPEHRADPWTV